MSPGGSFNCRYSLPVSFVDFYFGDSHSLWFSFRGALHREVGGPVIILWDNLRTHGSVLVKQRVEEHPDVRLEYLPPCAPDLNADEGVWQWLKDEPLGNFCAGDLEGLEERIRVEKRRLKRRRDIIQGFYRRCDLL